MAVLWVFIKSDRKLGEMALQIVKQAFILVDFALFKISSSLCFQSRKKNSCQIQKAKHCQRALSHGSVSILMAFWLMLEKPNKWFASFKSHTQQCIFNGCHYFQWYNHAAAIKIIINKRNMTPQIGWLFTNHLIAIFSYSCFQDNFIIVV